METPRARDQKASALNLPEGWQVTVAVKDVPPFGLVEAMVGDKLILILRNEHTFVAVQGLCPHAWARLSGGHVADGWLHCPRHQVRFRLSDGACGPGWQLPPLQRYETQIHAGFILVPNPLLPIQMD